MSLADFIFAGCVTLVFIWSLSRATQCYYCGTRRIHKYSKYNTRAICATCEDSDGVCK